MQVQSPGTRARMTELFNNHTWSETQPPCCCYYYCSVCVSIITRQFHDQNLCTAYQYEFERSC